MGGLGVFGSRLSGAGGVTHDNIVATLSQLIGLLHTCEIPGTFGEPICIIDECFGGSIFVRLSRFHQGTGFSTSDSLFPSSDRTRCVSISHSSTSAYPASSTACSYSSTVLGKDIWSLLLSR